MRAITGEGFTFLNIPRTYYGLLEPALLTAGGVAGELLLATTEEEEQEQQKEEEEEEEERALPRALTDEEAEEVISALRRAGLVDDAGAVSLDALEEEEGGGKGGGTGEEGKGGAGGVLEAALNGAAAYRDRAEEEGSAAAMNAATRRMVRAAVRRSAYANLYRLLGDQLDEATYLRIVRNKILIDVQGEDVLMQIFTSVVLQREPGIEAPFLEFIQRLCAPQRRGEGATEGAGETESGSVVASSSSSSSSPVRPGCGGFGIRNFLTLFLSIEVSKALLDAQEAAAAGRDGEQAFHDRRVALFTEQLVEANPILTEISDCMTAEGKALDAADATAAADWAARKEAANRKLADCSRKYNDLMGELREAGWSTN
jgi:hypothetical protein